MAVMDGYIRISKVNGRNGDSFISPQIQRETIERIARDKGVELGEIVEERDVSGGKKVRERELGRLVEKVEDGESDGLIVWKATRFSRNLLDTVESMTRIKDAGGRLLADDFDSKAPMSKALIGLLGGLAEEELDARRDGWDEARRRAVERGVQVAAAPVGYRKGRDGRLVVYEREAQKVREIFERRAGGESVTVLARETGWPHIKKILSNDTYLGVVRSGKYVNERAHEPIVDRDLYERANAGRTTRPVPAGETTRERLLIGLARCVGCGATLKVTRRKDRSGKQLPDVYYCRNELKRPCPARALVRCDELDAHLARWFERQLGTNPAMVDAVAANRRLEDALAEEAEAKDDLTNFVTAVKVSDPAVFQAGLEAREARLAETQAAAREAQGRVAQLPEGGSLLELWHRFDPAGRRRVLGEWLDRVEVSRGASADLAGSVEIFWLDGSPADDEDDARVAAA
jgi:DNA invertase Pin-like site-specific DNA recombinase